MTRHPILFVVAVVVLGCSVVGGLFWAAYNGGAPEPAEPVKAMAAQAMELQATATGTPSPVPTPDYSGAYPVQTQAEAAGNLAKAQQKIADAEATIAAAVATHAEGTRVAPYNAMLQGTPTAVEMTRVAVVGTEQARATNDAGQRAAYFAGVQATQDAEADAERRKTNRDDALYIIALATIAAAILIVVGAIASAVRGRAGEAAPEELPKPEINQTQTVQIAHPEVRAVYEHEVKITQAERATLRRAVVELGGVLSRRRLNGENPNRTVYFSENRAEQILSELRRENANGVGLAVLGPNSVTLAMPQLYQWLGLPTPPQVKKSPETSENTEESHPTPPHASGAEPENTEGEGAGKDKR